MSILSGYKKFKRYVLTDNGYQLCSQWTSSNTVHFDDGNTAQTKVGAINGITDSLTATSSNVALSAKSGKNLQDQITALNTGLDGKASSSHTHNAVAGYTFDLATANSTDTWLLVQKDMKIQHRDVSTLPFFPDTGGTVNGPVNAGGKVGMKSDNEGGNFWLTSPDGTTWEIDAVNDNLRIFTYANNVKYGIYITKEGKVRFDNGFNVTPAMLMKGATTSAAGAAGLVPAPAKGAVDRYLRSDGAWVVPPDTKGTYQTSNENGNWFLGKMSGGLKIISGYYKETTYNLNEAYGNLYWTRFAVTLPEYFDNILNAVLTPYSDTGLYGISIQKWEKRYITGYIYGGLNEIKPIILSVFAIGV